MYRAPPHPKPARTRGSMATACALLGRSVEAAFARDGYVAKESQVALGEGDRGGSDHLRGTGCRVADTPIPLSSPSALILGLPAEQLSQSVTPAP